MSNLRHILKFGWPYIQRYKVRFVTGILLGLVFAASMGILLEVGRLVLKRLDRPTTQEAAVTETQRRPESSIAVVQWFRSIEDRVKSARSQWTAGLDPWLPLRGRALDSRQIIGVLLIFPFLMAFRGFTGYLSSYCLGWVSERVINDLQVDVLKKLHTLSLDYFNKSQLGDLTARVQSDTAWLHRTLSLGLSDLVKEPSTVLFLFLMLLSVDWQMTLFAMIFLPLCVLPITILGKKIRKAADRSVKTKVSQSSLLLEILSGIRVVKAFGLEEQQARRFSDYANDLVRYGMKGIKAKELVNPIIETVTALILGVMLVVMFKSGRDSDDVLALVIGLVAMYGPFKKIAGLHVLFEQSSAGVTRLAQILEERPTVQDPPRPKALTSFERAITFENVSFRYADKPVLQNISITVRRGERLGIAGESGCGKSTLLNLLPRFYDVTSGAVKIDGIDIREVSMHDLRQQMALVSQEIVIFDQTIAGNIGCGRIGATRQEIESAAKAAHAHEFIAQQAEGYDSMPGERGVTLSVGQRQRLAIARAFVRDAPILILDEATASLDAKSEAEVQNAIDALAEHRTVICVAHRLSTLANMDRIIVLDHGRMVEEGTFQQLLRSSGLFASMAAKQGLQPS